MKKSTNNYFVLSLFLMTVGTALTALKVDYYLDIVVLVTAAVIGVLGCTKMRKQTKASDAYRTAALGIREFV